ncbi:tRNA (adenosine(37)-N6)-dimethylallyltransferase MiaA [Treponema sp. OMZ 840]|uniref:tRNA (adenosine(37)-N6)-dimethylallyltransferase MiaA n=1 Tax=Treponema sp. OMZ 840 TaxID=244313 RepID=UPI003D8D9446
MDKSIFTESDINCLVVLGPTAVGKTALAVRLAEHFNAEILSADSRQVYRGLDIGSGKDLDEYTVPYHLIDITDLSVEYSVFDYQRDFYTAFNTVRQKEKVPLIAGGTGLYLDAVIRVYDMKRVPENPVLREKLSSLHMDELCALLYTLKQEAGTEVHNTTDTETRARLIRAIEIETYNAEHKEKKANAEDENKKAAALHPLVKPLIIGTTFPRDMLRAAIRKRLKARLAGGMIEEVENLHRTAPGLTEGASWERLERLGLEYRFIAEYIQGRITSREELETKLGIAIGQFAKRQETWFRGMQKKGVHIHWLEHNGTHEDCSVECRFEQSLRLLRSEQG